MAAIALVGDEAFDCTADLLFNVGDDAIERVPVVGVARASNSS